MAIKPLEQRLASILPESPVSDSVLPQDSDELASGAGMEPVQVAGAGLLRGLIKGGAKLVEEGKAAREATEASKLVDTPPVPQPPGTEGAIPQASLPQAPTSAAPKPPPPGPPEGPAPSTQPLENQLKLIEDTVGEAPVAGKPPELLSNLNQIVGPDDFKQLVDTLYTSSGLKIGRLTWQETIARAKKKGVSSELLGDIQAMGIEYGELPVNLVRLRVASYQNAAEFYDLAKRSYLEPDNMDLKAQLLYKLNSQNVINETYLTARTSAAQATAAGRITITPEMARGMLRAGEGVDIPAADSDAMRIMLKDPEVDQNLKVLVEKFVQLTDDGAREGLLNKVGKTGLALELWERTWKNGLLSGLGTHVVNLTSSASFLASSVATRALAGGVGTVRRAMGGSAQVELGESAAMIAGIVHSTREAFNLAGKALLTGTTREMRAGADLLSDAGQKFEGSYKILDARDYGFENELFVAGVNGWAQFTTLLGGRPIMAMDEIFKTWGYRAELYAQAYRESAQARRAALDTGKTADEADAAGLTRMGQILSDPPDSIADAATEFGQMITFTKQLTGSSAKMQDFVQDHLAARIIMPFVKTPIWIGSETLQHSAFAPLSRVWREDYNAGGARRELAMAKMGMGSMLMIGAGTMVADGRMTGGGPGDTNLRKIYLDSGWRPYSFVFQNEEWDEEFAGYLRGKGIDPSISTDGRLYVPFRGIDPLAGPMAMVADAVEYARYEDDQDVVAQVLLGGVWGLYNYMGQLPVLTSVSAIAGAFSATVPNPKHAFKSALDSIAAQATSFVIEGSPVGVFSGSRAMIERGMDPTRRMTAESPSTPTLLKGFFEGLNRSIARTPILSAILGQQYDYLGEEMTDVDPSAPWLASTTGIRFSQTKQRPADKVMVELGMPIKKPTMDFSYQGVRVKLEADEYAWMMRQLGRIEDPSGNRLKDAIWATYTSPEFELLDLDVQQDTIKAKYQEFTEAARNELLMNSPFSAGLQSRIEKAMDRKPRLGNYGYQ
jgi:hypothetical protein